MYKNILLTGSLLLIILSASNTGSAQVNWQTQCGAVPSSGVSLLQTDTVINGDSVIVIPTVFHIITQGGPENISKTHVQRALQILNQDFNRNNPDTADIPAPFHPLRGNPTVAFRLARIDPMGNCTDGIDRIYSPLTGALYNFDQLQPAFSWDHTRYMNIYVVNWIDYVNSPLSLGASYVAPIDSGQNFLPKEDALVVIYTTLADGFNEAPPGRGGHILSHETGHNLGLIHPWGWSADCISDDDVSDTPIQYALNLGCPSFPHISCNNAPDGDMFNNFMDYAECQNMFTEGQADRMRYCLAHNEWRASLWTPSNLAATGVDNSHPICTNPPVADFGYGNYAGWLCAGRPVQFYEASAWHPDSYQWEFTDGIPSTSTDTFPSVTFPGSGQFKVRLMVSNSIGTDTVEKTIQIQPAEVSYNASLTESFEDSVFNQQIVPYTLLGKKWAVTDLAASAGTHSIRLDSGLKYFSIFFTHIYDLDLLPLTGRKLEFKVACGLSAGGAAIVGGLRVTWKRPYAYERWELLGNTEVGVESGALHPGDALLPAILQTAITNAVFIPDSTQWQTITLDIPDSLTGEIQIGFDWGNFTPTNKLKGLYIDDIKVMAPVGIAANNAAITWSIFPNPATDLLSITLPGDQQQMDVTITTITGKIIYKNAATATQKIEINTNAYAAGVYLVKVQTGKFTETKKVIIQN